jgi:invasion protein IalB
MPVNRNEYPASAKKSHFAAMTLVASLLVAGGPVDAQTSDASGGNAGSATTDLGDWKVNEVTDPMTDKKVVLLMVQSREDSVTFGLNCQQSNGSVGVVWGRFLGGDELDGIEYKSVTYRIDDNKPVEDTWQVMEDRTTTRVIDGPAFIKEVRAGSRLAIKISPYQEMPLTVVFDTHGLTEMLTAHQKDCEPFVRDILWDRYQKQLNASSTGNGEK